MFVKYLVDVSIVLCGVMCVRACVHPLIGGVHAHTAHSHRPKHAQCFCTLKGPCRTRALDPDVQRMCSYVQPCAYPLHITVCAWLYVRVYLTISFLNIPGVELGERIRKHQQKETCIS